MLSRPILRQFVRSPARNAVFNEYQAQFAMSVRALSVNGLISSRSQPHRKPYFLQGTVVNKFSSSHVSTSRDSPKEEEQDISKLSGVKRLKMLWKNYGVLTLVTYFSLYGCTLTGMFFALEADLLSASSFGLDAASVIASVCCVALIPFISSRHNGSVFYSFATLSKIGPDTTSCPSFFVKTQYMVSGLCTQALFINLTQFYCLFS